VIYNGEMQTLKLERTTI